MRNNKKQSVKDNENRRSVEVPLIIRGTCLSFDQLNGLKAEMDNGKAVLNVDIPEQFAQRLLSTYKQFKSYYLLSEDVALFEILLIILRKCDQCPMRSDEMKIVSERVDLTDSKRNIDKLHKASKTTWLKLVLDEILAQDVTGHYCQMLNLYNLWRYNPDIESSVVIQSSDLLALHSFIESNYGLILSSILLHTNQPEVGVVYIHPSFRYCLKSLDEVEKRINLTLIQILQSACQKPCQSSQNNISSDQFTTNSVDLVTENLITETRNQHKAMLTTKTNIYKEHYENLGRIYLADYLHRYQLKANPKHPSQELRFYNPSDMNGSIPDKGKLLSGQINPKSGLKTTHIVSGSEVLGRNPSSPHYINKGNETRNRTEEFQALESVLAKLQTGSNAHPLGAQVDPKVQMKSLTIEILDQNDPSISKKATLNDLVDTSAGSSGKTV